MSAQYIAHVRQLEDGTWASPHKLSEHIAGTASLAESFTSEFSSEGWGRAAGLAHFHLTVRFFGVQT